MDARALLLPSGVGARREGAASEWERRPWQTFRRGALARGGENALSVVKSLWASIQGDPKFMRAVNGWLTIFWIGMIPVSLVTGWISSVTYVAALSLWALVSGHWSAWQAARVEVKQDEVSDDTPVAERVVEKLVEDTTVEPLPGRGFE
jgi:hypothetical protein